MFSFQLEQQEKLPSEVEECRLVKLNDTFNTDIYFLPCILKREDIHITLVCEQHKDYHIVKISSANAEILNDNVKELM